MMLYLILMLNKLGALLERRPSQRLSRPVAVRAAGFIEYAMLAAIAIGIYVFFRPALTGALSTLIEKVGGIIGRSDQ